MARQGRRTSGLIRSVQQEGAQGGLVLRSMRGSAIFLGMLTPGRSEESNPLRFMLPRVPAGIHVEMTGKNVTECTGARGRSLPRICRIVTIPIAIRD